MDSCRCQCTINSSLSSMHSRSPESSIHTRTPQNKLEQLPGFNYVRIRAPLRSINHLHQSHPIKPLYADSYCCLIHTGRNCYIEELVGIDLTVLSLLPFRLSIQRYVSTHLKRLGAHGQQDKPTFTFDIFGLKLLFSKEKKNPNT